MKDKDLKAALEVAKLALESVPSKFQIDFPLFWMWHEGARDEALKMIDEALA